MHENALGKRPANKVVRVGRIVQNYLRAATAVKIVNRANDGCRDVAKTRQKASWHVRVDEKSAVRNC